MIAPRLYHPTTVLLLALMFGCGGNNTDGTAQRRDDASKSELPVRVTDDGWYLTTDCILNLYDGPYRETDAGKALFAKSVVITPVERTNLQYTIRPTDSSRSRIELFADAIPLKGSMGMATDDGKVIIAGGEGGNILGGDVTTKPVAKGTKIMRLQPAELVDAKGTAVLPHR